MAIDVRGGAYRVRGRQGQGSHGPLSEGQGRECPREGAGPSEGVDMRGGARMAVDLRGGARMALDVWDRASRERLREGRGPHGHQSEGWGPQGASTYGAGPAWPWTCGVEPEGSVDVRGRARSQGRGREEKGPQGAAGSPTSRQPSTEDPLPQGYLDETLSSFLVACSFLFCFACFYV